MRIGWDVLKDLLGNKGRVHDGGGFSDLGAVAGLGSAGRSMALDMLDLKGHCAACPQAALLTAAR